MARILLTGMSGTGKSTVLHTLAERGHLVLDTDHGGWVLDDGTWDEPRMWAFLRSTPSVVVSGTVENQGRFAPAFHAVVLLSAPLPVLLHRVRTREGNPYGRSAADRDEIARNLRDVEPLLRAAATVELDAREPVAVLADAVEALVRHPRQVRRLRG
jgi:shikimate kinase